jgi:hypothetical protein
VCDFNGDVFRGVLTTMNVDDTQTLYKNNFHGWLRCVCVSPNNGTLFKITQYIMLIYIIRTF